ncbi:adenylate/guanylate cyclase domain-containing protein [Bradyrhizobium sp.]|jgi:adenylate cyclase|uniref:adenylate/guanylate cyclase domain-containing protein n=1 Tax=Bradyrhizobium sp. TaxID=376 RepID=UPI002DDCE24D|nr:adenylate/guanylate cyclase domain-containing protein [Bradyrhizobium sp.]HEV2157875.1 adenylate/guanylate cyclase domain-containing protein [Bradyrhizobium sp.]
MSFRLTLTACVMFMIGLLAALLLFVQVLTLDLATEEAATSTMDATSRSTISSLQLQVEMLSRMSRALAFTPAIMNSSTPGDTSPTVGVLRGNLAQWPALDSIYVGYDNGHWLQVQRLGGMSGPQRDRVGGPPDAAYGVTTTQWLDGEELPTRRVFQDKTGNPLGQIDIPPRGYDARQRNWYLDARKAGHLVTSAPYLSFNLGVPMITFSVPVDGQARGVVGLDLKLDSYSKSAPIVKFGKKGHLLIFDDQGTLIVHPDYSALFEKSSTDPAGPRLPGATDLRDTLEGKIIASWDKSSPYRQKLAWKDGKQYFARLETIALGPNLPANVLLVAPEDEFAEGIRALDRKARLIALLACLLFIPAAWIFGTRMSTTIRDITAEAARLQTMAPPPNAPIGSLIRELDILALTIHKSQRAIWLFSRLAPRAIVRGVLDNSISTELGGVRQEITALFTDVRGFTTIAENADPDVLMQQTSRYFTALTDVILLQGGTVDKFIGDAVMAFWNAPNPQGDHCERACRAALQARAANEKVNRQFEAEGLPSFFTRFGIHVGEAVVGNLGSSERMNYTALGNVVNLAARLEGLNKQYDTQILVSEGVYLRVKETFRCRFVDTVVAKGMAAETRVYELLGEVSNEDAGAMEVSEGRG